MAEAKQGPKPSSLRLYYQKVFDSAKRCLREATDESHPAARQVMQMKNPRTGLLEQVMSLDTAAEWCMKNHLPGWAQGTWRMHRCGYRELLLKMVSEKRLTKERVDRIIDDLEKNQGLKKSERPKRTSARRKKVVTPKHVEQISTLVTERESEWGVALVLWLESAIATGLRPNEWRTAELIEKDDRLILRSENFKYNAERSYGPFREIDITDLESDTISTIKRHMNVVTGLKAGGLWQRYYDGCAALLYWCNKKLWPHRKANVTLYTGRHQFSANAKADESVSEVERAAMMGHGTTKTSSERYGYRRNGSSGLSPKVGNKDVLALIQQPEHRPRKPSATPNVTQSPQPTTSQGKK